MRACFTKGIFGVLFLVMTLVACNSDNNDPVPQKLTKCMVNAISYNGKTIRTYDYQPDGTIKKIVLSVGGSADGIYEFSFSGNTGTQTVRQAKRTTNFKLELDSKGYINKAYSRFDTTGVTSYDTIWYVRNAEDYLVKMTQKNVQYYPSQDMTVTTQYVTTFTIQNGNTVKAEIVNIVTNENSVPNPTVVETYEYYTDKLDSAETFAVITPNFQTGKRATNMLKRKTQVQGDDLAVRVTDYVYKYRADNLPEQIDYTENYSILGMPQPEFKASLVLSYICP
ncbi:hypothetical protein QNI16_10465 [Cytophagaceae bacterium YF14B1]|uniref:DUF4595 domain-containing protein n=1 Tax=Xanthocytophaga flava TaxID=3048013 RepID=A0AAE3QNZ4_9BACT|nr:hypothetical protein [Xanthocytophaga flavus]MDJ1480905.1 hypothetical protein [Xanthocytophaga flavus]